MVLAEGLRKRLEERRKAQRLRERREDKEEMLAYVRDLRETLSGDDPAGDDPALEAAYRHLEKYERQLKETIEALDNEK